MELGEGLRARLEELKQRADITPKLAAIAEGATLRAVERAVELTPPNTFEDGEARGAHTITGELAQHWPADSSVSAVGADFRTVLANDMQYASYVNDGHRVDKHFVPGLYIDPQTGLLSTDPAKPKGVGLLVGTKTTYVEGLHITEAAQEVYEEVVETELEKLTGEVFR